MPDRLRSDRLLLRNLCRRDAELDYDAVMASREQLRRWGQSAWPADDFTVEENREDLVRHEREHLDGEAFIDTVLNLTGTRRLGCVYIMLYGVTICKGDYAADIGFWARTSEVANDLDKHLLAVLLGWFAAKWVFDRIVFVISRRERRQAQLLREAGFEQRDAFELADGRPVWVFGHNA